jgi:hypothetical protein
MGFGSALKATFFALARGAPEFPGIDFGDAFDFV